MGTAPLTAAALRTVNEASPLDAALAYATLGLPVFPLAAVDRSTGQCLCRDGAACEQVGKHPLVRWADRATTDPVQIRRWWEAWQPAANVAIPTGQRSGLLVVDVDRQHDGLATRQALEAGGHRFPPTLAARSRNGGWHFYYQAPVGLRVANTTSAIAGLGATLGIDVRGDGGYIIAAPSVRPIDPDPATGAPRLGRYEWVAQDHPLAPAPAWVVTPLPRPDATPEPAVSTARRRAVTAGAGGAPKRAESALAAEVRLVATAAEHERNTRLFQAAANLFEICNTGHLDPAQVRAALTDAARSTGLGDREIAQTLDAQWRRKQGVRRPGWDSPPALGLSPARTAAPGSSTSSTAAASTAGTSAARVPPARDRPPRALFAASPAAGRPGFGR